MKLVRPTTLLCRQKRFRTNSPELRCRPVLATCRRSLLLEVPWHLLGSIRRCGVPVGRWLSTEVLGLQSGAAALKRYGLRASFVL